MDREHFEVTDDVSIVEALGLPVKLTPGSETNIKVTSCSCCLSLEVRFPATAENHTFIGGHHTAVPRKSIQCLVNA